MFDLLDFSHCLALLDIDIFPPNIAAQWLSLLLSIRELLGSNLGPETG
jgi:hypothetical protein